MWASQLIYTACGQDKSGAYSVWAKSNDITENESNEISKVMSYRQPNDVPYEPTEEQIKEFYPKKYGYFQLSTGRKVIAQTTYIGRKYSDSDPRWGNFIIHAYVFDEWEDYNPFRLLIHTQFKDCLTYEEWHENSAPDDLPKVEVRPSPNLDVDFLCDFMIGGQKNAHLSFLQAIIDSASSDEKITFNDVEENNLKTYNILGVLLPSDLLRSYTFVTQYVDDMENNIEVAPIRIRNIFSNDLLNTYGQCYDYREEIAHGKKCFYFTQNIYTDVRPKLYVNDLAAAFASAQSILAILKRNESISNISRESGVDLDAATMLYHIRNNDFSLLTSAKEYKYYSSVALKNGYISDSELVDFLFNDIIFSGKWGDKKEIKELVEFVYDKGDQNVKNTILENYRTDLFSDVADVDDISYADGKIKENLPFEWKDLARYISLSAECSEYIENATSVAQLYIIYDCVITTLVEKIGSKTGEAEYNYLINIIDKSIKRRSINEIVLYFDKANCLGGDYSNALINEAVGLFIDNDCGEADYNFAFDLIASIKAKPIAVKLLCRLIVKNMASDKFMRCYIDCEAKNPELFRKLAVEAKDISGYALFLERKEMFLFDSSEQISSQKLSEYFRKYYKAGKDRGGYYKKLKSYLASLDSKTKAPVCMGLYNEISSLDDKFCDVVQIMECVLNELFSMSLDELAKFFGSDSKQFEALVSFVERIKKASGNVPDHYYVLFTLLLIRGTCGEDKRWKAVSTDKLYVGLDGSELNEFVSAYFADVLNLYFRYAEKAEKSDIDFLSILLRKPLTECKNADKYIVEAMERLEKDKYYRLYANILAYSLNKQNDFAKKLHGFITSYIDNSKVSENKKTLKKVVELVSEKEQATVKKFVDKYLNDNMGFFEKLFAKKEIKDEATTKIKNDKKQNEKAEGDKDRRNNKKR